MKARHLLCAFVVAGCARGPGADPSSHPTEPPVVVDGLASAVTIAEDGLGVPTIDAASRLDALRALGWVTARDRLFQMDLLRRNSAGRLAELFGPELLEVDRHQRHLGLGRAASAILQRLPEAQRDALDAYAQGVNAYVRAATELPLELRLLGYTPEPWRAEDSVLVVLGMVQTLSSSEDLERTRTVLAQSLPADAIAFLFSPDPYTQALLGLKASAAIPVRALTGARADARLAARAGEPPVGSNGWAVAGAHTRDGRALLANDMHLELEVPNLWYRAALRYEDVALDGVLIPGVPVVIAGSNRHVAWGLTSLEGDVEDLVRLEVDPERPDEYRTPQGWKRFGTVAETIAVRGQAEVTIDVRTTIWGPVAERPLLGAPVALRWTALDPDGVDLGMLALDRARTVDDAIAIFSAAGGPACNAILADRDGRVAWTVTGRIPRRRGFDGSVAVSWSDGRAGWDGFVDAAALPRIVDPPTGFVVSGNQRMVAADAPVLSHGYGNGYRAYRITERLRALDRIGEADLLAIQLDTRSALYDAYRDAALAARAPELAEAQRAIAAWDGRAETSSLGFALIVRFRRIVAERIFAVWLERARAVDPDLELLLGDIDTPVQRVLRERPDELVPPPARDWDAFLAAALGEAAAQVRELAGDRPLDRLEWGAVNRVGIAHPLGGLPDLEDLDMPDEPLAGCGFCVRMAAGTLGASERLVVSPGHEADGIFHMPAGQSGDPASPHYRDQQRAWLDGAPLPFLPGAAVRTRTLVPPSTTKETR